MGSENVITTSHDLYQRFGLRMQRHVRLDEHTQELSIADVWQPLSGYTTVYERISCWNFTLAPGITPIKTHQGWQLWHQQRLLVTMVCSTLEFTCAPAWFSPSYGVKVTTLALQSRCIIQSGATTIIRFLT
jgi:hypothetical protein